MSTVKTVNLQNPSAASPAIVLAADGTATANVSAINGGPLAGFRSAIVNGSFDHWQRGTSFTGNVYGADRWVNSRSGTTCTMSRQAFTLGQTDVPGEPTYFCRMAVTSVAGAANYSHAYQNIESVRTFAGQQITVSFWAKADATRNIAVSMAQVFGTGGSPSSNVFSISPAKYALSSSWQKITHTLTLPSISGKTLGTDGNDYLRLEIWFDAGSNFNSRTDTLGQQSGTFDIAQVQVEAGPVATPFERRPIGVELVLCQRYYWQFSGTGGSRSFSAGSTSSTGGYRAPVWFPVDMRTVPSYTSDSDAITLVFGGTTFTSTSASLSSATVRGGHIIGSITPTASASGLAGVALVADGKVLRFDAEL